MKTLVIFIALQVAISFATSVRRPVDIRAVHGTLTLESREKRSNTHIRGAFHSEDGDGIRFETSEKSLVVTTMDGESLVNTGEIPVTVQNYGESGTARVYKIMDDAYIESNEKVYRLANTEVDFQTTHSFTHAQLLENVQAEELYDSEGAIKASVQRLIAHPAVRLLEPTARAMGEDTGIIGSKEPAAMAFYAAAMTLTQLYEEHFPVEPRSYRSASSSIFETFFDSPATVQKYPNCNLKTCPPCKSDECIGLCGRRCNCWKWVCGDCCLKVAYPGNFTGQKMYII